MAATEQRSLQAGIFTTDTLGVGVGLRKNEHEVGVFLNVSAIHADTTAIVYVEHSMDNSSFKWAHQFPPVQSGASETHYLSLGHLTLMEWIRTRVETSGSTESVTMATTLVVGTHRY